MDLLPGGGGGPSAALGGKDVLSMALPPGGGADSPEGPPVVGGGMPGEEVLGSNRGAETGRDKGAEPERKDMPTHTHCCNDTAYRLKCVFYAELALYIP